MRENSFKQYIVEMAKVTAKPSERFYDAMSDENYWESSKTSAKLIRKFGEYGLYRLIAKNKNILYVLSDKLNYVASIEVDTSSTTTIEGKHGIMIDAGFSKIRGGYAKLLDALLNYTDNHFILSDISLSDRAAKFWDKYLGAIDELNNTPKYTKILYNQKTKEVINYDNTKAFYDKDNNPNSSDNANWHIGILK